MNIELTSEEANELKCILNEYKGVNVDASECLNVESILKKLDEVPLEKITILNK